MARMKEETSDQAVLERARSYALDCKEYTDFDNEKIFTIKLSKAAKIYLAGRDKQGNSTLENIELPGNQELEVDIVVLRELVTKAVQEGPSSMRLNYFTQNGPSRDSKALSITVLGEKLRPGSGFSYTLAAKDLISQGIPTLNEG